MGIMADVLNWVRLSPKYILPIALLSASLLFLPEASLGRFGLDAFVTAYRMWIALVFLASCALLLSDLGCWAKDKISYRVVTRRLRKIRSEYLRRLTVEEKLVLARYVLLQSKTQDLDAKNGVVNGLEQMHVIYRCSYFGTFNSFAYNLQPWAWDELNSNPQLLEPELSWLSSELQLRR